MDQPTLFVELQRDHRALHEHYVFVRSPVHIGRGPRNELTLDHAFVSHAHGVLHFDASGIDFVDLGSTNGSFLDGARLESHHFASVAPGASLAVGPSRMRMRLEPPSPHGTARHEAPSNDARDALLTCFAHAFVELTCAQRERLGPAQSSLSALEGPAALLAYLLTPGCEAPRLAELNAACAELVHNARAR